jgi:hypothetical protein
MNEKLVKLLKTKNFIYVSLMISIYCINIVLLPMYVNAISVIIICLSQMLIIRGGIDVKTKT